MDPSFGSIRVRLIGLKVAALAASPNLHYMLGTSRLLLIAFLHAPIIGWSQPNSTAQDLPLITAALMDYIDGTANGDPEQVRRAFHPDFNLYTVNDVDSLMVRSGAKYIDGIKVGEKNTRQGRIVSIDVEGNAAMAKAEIAIPGWRIFTDYFLLLKYEGAWRIVQKSYSWRAWPKEELKK